MNQQYYIYSRTLIVLILACCIEFNYYKTRVYFITVFYNTLKLNHIILYHIWYLPHDEPTVLYIFQNTPSIDISMLYWINQYKTWITALQSYNTITSLITSFCLSFDNWYMMNHHYYIYSRNSKYWYQHAVWNLITTRRELLHYSHLIQSQA